MLINQYIKRIGFRNFIKLSGLLLNNSVSFLLNKKGKQAPLYLAWIVHNRCNCRCIHCNTAEVYKTNDLSFEKQLAVADRINQSHVKFISIMGGELLLEKGIFDILRRMKGGKDKFINFVTNGTLLKEFMKDILSSPIDSLTISMDGSTAELHDAIRSYAGLYTIIVDAIDEIKKQKPSLKIFVRYTIMSQNVHDIEKFYNKFKGKVDHISFQPIQNSPVHKTRDENAIQGDQDAYDRLTRAFKNLSKQAPEFNGDYYKYLPDFLYNPESLLKNNIFRCLFHSIYHMVIVPDGRAFPCAKYMEGFNVGQLPQQSIEEIWEKDEFFRLQKEMRKNRDCICWSYDTFPNHVLNKFYKITTIS